MSYGGKTCDSLTHFKEQYHRSKAQNAIYTVSCDCGCHYVGESMRNLKIRIHEHELKSSKSTISLHILEENEKLRKRNLPQTHRIDHLSPNLISQEKNFRKRKFIESICIKSKSHHLCNMGGSVAVSDIWDPSLPKIAKLLKALD